jgi:IS30 family transposase
METLRKRWSPREIVRRRAAEYPEDRTMRISHEAIYRYIYVLPRGETRGKIVEMLSIEERPHEVADRAIPGHWEGDLIMGKHPRTALGTLVERTPRYTILVPLTAKDATSVRKAYAKALRSLPGEITKTLTYDQGKEMSEHKQCTIDPGMTVYFAHPGAPWERGTNEHTNGLLRQYVPKGTAFDKVSTREIKRVQRELNDRPRAVLHWQKPTEVINHLVALKV